MNIRTFLRKRGKLTLAVSAGLVIATAGVFVSSRVGVRTPSNSDHALSNVKPSQHKITWSQPEIDVTLSPGESLSKDTTLTSTLPLTNITVEAVPEIARFLAATPSSFATVPANQPQLVQVSFSIAPATALGTYEGTIHVRSGRQTLPQTLKVVLNIAWQSRTDTAHGFTINYPVDWSVRQSQDSLVFSSTPSPRRLEGDPGDEINITVFPRDGFPTVLDWVKDHYNGEIEVTVNSIESYRNPFGVQFIKLREAPDLFSDNISAFVIINDQVIQISITPASQFQGLYDAMLDTFRTN